ncbi:hypothetical protein HMPREF3038_02452 [Akkermansia sp. KLE1797]|nr:hypothetical protein HMPREF3038_02452 [Akkermansia sp. KLE1797]
MVRSGMGICFSVTGGRYGRCGQSPEISFPAVFLIGVPVI